jgi:hypothetical protein
MFCVDIRSREHVVDVNACHAPGMVSPPATVYVRDTPTFAAPVQSSTVMVPAPYAKMDFAGFAAENEDVSADEPLV